jgi:outer membrane receptor for ferrienterochelin and colicin
MLFPHMGLPRIIRGPMLVLMILLSASGIATAQRRSVPDTSARPTEVDLAVMDLEQLMKIQVIVAASKREQTTRDVPSLVSIVTAAQIREHGYRTLGDVLKTLPSFYVSNDRNYSYVGVRGFERPGDFNSRILLLLNGLRTNENVFDLSFVGEEFAVDVDLIERIEVIRGPSAALYGSNAFFAVINVVTKQGRSMQGGEVAATAASFGTYAGRASYGRVFPGSLDVMVSASYSDSDGQTFYYPEFDAPATNNGIAAGVDQENFHKLLATVARGHWSFQATTASRTKGIPTGSFETIFNDKRNRTTDATSLAGLSYNRSLSKGATLSARLHGGRYEYLGEYAYVAAVAPNLDEVVGEWWGVDLDAARPLPGRQFVTVGAEFRDNLRQTLKNWDPEPLFVHTDVTNRSAHWGAFVQDEIKLLTTLTLHAGLRVDRFEAFGLTTSPRLGAIYTPGTATTIKVLAGRAFRAPNEFELHYENSQYKPNPQLRPERIGTLELVAQRFIGRGFHVKAAAFRNHLSALINQRLGADGMFVSANEDAIESRGIELGAEMNRGHGPSGQLTYSLQRTEDRATGIELTSSPRQMVKLRVLAPARFATAGLDAQYVSAKGTLGGARTREYILTNLSLLAPRVFKRVDVSATLYNVFDVTYGVPVSEGHRQDILQQDGRSFRVKTTLHY